jgi:hypothetical protein
MTITLQVKVELVFHTRGDLLFVVGVTGTNEIIGTTNRIFSKIIR